MFKKMILAVSFGLVWCANGAAQAVSDYDRKLAGSEVYSDPGFQEFMETSCGYLSLSSRNTRAGDFRDAVISSAASQGKAVGAAAKAEKYLFVSILPKVKNYSALVREISVSAGFVLSGERTVHIKKARRTRIVGWVRAAGLDAIRKNPGVAWVSLERKGL